LDLKPEQKYLLVALAHEAGKPTPPGLRKRWLMQPMWEITADLCKDVPQEALDHLPAIYVMASSPAMTPGTPLCTVPGTSGLLFVQRAGVTRVRKAMTDSAKMSLRSPATIWAAFATVWQCERIAQVARNHALIGF
jgi:hypothetical protein